MMLAVKCSMIVWIAILSIQLLVQSLITAAIIAPSSSLRGQPQSPYYDVEQSAPIQTSQNHQDGNPNHQRTLEDANGIEACKDCQFSQGKKCVGRTITDENCDNCSKGQAFWPCDLVKECWCWDTSLPRDPGDDDDKDRACSGCGRGGEFEVCASNQNSLVPVEDAECQKCMDEGQSFWPCDDQDLCWCWDTTKPKKPPAPASGLNLAIEYDPSVLTPCDIITKEKFMILAPNSTFPYTYDGLCDAIDDYNEYHTEKFAAMGTIAHITNELAAFLGNTAHESDDFEAGREYLACGDRKEVDGKVYCKPCNNDLYDWINNVCEVSMVDQNAPYNSYCQPTFEPPEGCVCGTITQVEESGPLAGYVEASKVFYGRGAIQLSWNYNYIRASYALTGKAETFCENPELVATSPGYAWGAGIYFWMENQKEGSTCHKEALKGDFGGTLNNINGGLECPAYKGGWHADAIKMRLNRYCHAASQLGLPSLLDLSGCKGMTESYEECLGDGHCPHCEQYAGVATKNFTNIEMPEVIAQPDISRPTPAEEEDSEMEQPIVSTSTAKPTPAPVVYVETAWPTTMPISVTPAPMPNPAPVSEIVTYMPTPEPVSKATTYMPTPAPASGETPAPISEVATSVPTPAFSITMADPSSTETYPSPTESSSLNEASSVTDSPTPSDASLNSSISPTGSPVIAAPEPSNHPTLTPTTKQPTVSPINTPSQDPTTSEPSYTPTTPQPTMGPCDGDSCPGEFCRSAYGFCGGGSAYCNEKAIWSPDCKDNSKKPSPSPTLTNTAEPSKSPAEKATPILDSVFKVTKAPVSSGDDYVMTRSPISSDNGTMNEPTKKPTVPGGKGSTFIKPTGGKDKPTGGKPKPGSSSGSSSGSKPQTTTNGAETLPSLTQTDAETADAAGGVLNTDSTASSPITQAPTSQPISESPTLRPTVKVYSPADPESTYFCGANWEEANTSCLVRCPSSRSEDCPADQKCFAFTSCMEEPEEIITDQPATGRPTNPPFTNAPATQAPVTPAPINEDTLPNGCTGTPCPFAGECRSQYGFCGTSFIYCNPSSSWTFELCGLMGADINGDPALCDAEVLRCPDGEEAYRDPANECEYFQCPADEEEENEITSSAFHIPAPSPTSKFPELPKPTLPTITKPSPAVLPDVSKPSSGDIEYKTVDLGKKPSGSADVVIVGNNDDIADDGGGEEPANKNDGDDEQVNEEIKPVSDKPELTEMQVGSFSAQEWLANSAYLNCHAGRRWVSFVMPTMAMIITLCYR